MSRNPTIKKILLIGSCPILIGQTIKTERPDGMTEDATPSIKSGIVPETCMNI